MSFTVTINYGTGDVELTDYSTFGNLVYHDSLKKTTIVHGRQYKHETSTASFSFEPKPSLMSSLFGLDRDQTITVAIEEDGSAWFTGYVKPVTKFNDQPGHVGNAVDVECVDAGWILQNQPSTYLARDPDDSMTVCDTTTTAQSLIHWLLTQAGFAGSISAFDITDSIDWFLMRPDETFIDILNDVCFSFHCSFYFDESGNFVLYDWGEESGDISSTATIDEDSIKGDLNIERETTDIATPEVEYYDLVVKEDVSVHSSTAMFGLDYDGSNQVWQPYSYDRVFIDSTATHTISAEYEFPQDAEGVISSRLKVVGRGRYSAVPLYLAGFEKTKYISLPATDAALGGDFQSKVSSTGSTDTYLYSYLFEYTGDNNADSDGLYEVTSLCNLYCREKAGTALGKDIGSDTKTYKGLYCYNETAGKTLATALSYNLDYGEYKYTFDSQTSYTPGLYYTITNDEANVSALCRIVKKTEKIITKNITIYSYEARRYSGFSAVVDSVTEATGSKIVTANDDSKPIIGSDLQASTDVTMAETGLYLCSDILGYYDAVEEDWLAYIKNDGTFLFSDGGSNSIEFDGSAFTVNADVALNGTVQAGDNIQSDNYSEGSAGWIITGNGDIEANSLTLRAQDVKNSLVNESAIDISNYYSAVPWWMRVMRMDGTGLMVDGKSTTTGGTDVVYSAAQTNRRDYSLFTSAGNVAQERIYDVAPLDFNSTITTGIFGWIYIDTMSSYTGTSAPLVLVLSNKTGDGYIRCYAQSDGTLYVDFDDNTNQQNFTSTAAIAVDTWTFIAVWLQAGKIYTLINETEQEHTPSPAVSTYQPDDETYVIGYAENAYNTDAAVFYMSEVGYIRDSSGDIDPYSTFNAYYNGSEPWNEKFWDGALNIGTEIRSSEGIFPPGFIYGLNTELDTDSDHDIKINVGKARGSLDRYNLILESPITKQIDATWSAGDNAGGLFYGTVAADTTYHLFLIRKQSDGTIDAGFDTSINCVNIPNGYTAYRRVASFVTDGSANLIPFLQHGHRFTYDVAITELDTTTISSSQTDIPISIPSGVRLLVGIRAILANTNQSQVVFSCPDQEPGTVNEDRCQLATSNASVLSSGQFSVQSDISGNISYKGAGDLGLAYHFTVSVEWYEDQLGKFDGV